MKIGIFEVNGRTILGELEGETLYGLAWPDNNMRSLIRRGITPSRTYERFPLASATIKAPLIPGKIIAIGKNYAEHAKETGGAVPDSPLMFAKLPSAIIGHRDTIAWRTSITNQVDWECELAVVIGKTAKNVSEADALKYVFGYTLANDVTARDLQNSDSQWTRAKGLDTFCPLGPVIVTKDAIPDPQNVGLRTMVNAELMQNGNTSDMVFGVAALIAYISSQITLDPGDVILTGTPSGVGSGMNPQRSLSDGDVVTVSADAIGDLTNSCRVIA
ncbi:MAG: fumarylacetoacetate hydrolase family protein [Chloroflexota bacterium]|nr:fumarylacetoacetate hydrolase family protein [Chloroflexota bacterium]